MNLKEIASDQKIDLKILIFSFLIIIITGLILRLNYVELELPIILDGLNYFLYASNISQNGILPNTFTPSNNGWPIFLSIFFTLITFDNIIEYMQLQKVITIIISTLTVIPVYFLCRKFFERNYSLIGAAIFIFEPRIIQNSLFGITESLYLLLGTITLVLFLSSKKFIYISFGLVALLTMVRSEGLFLFIALSILFLIKYRPYKNKNLLKFVLAMSIFILILLPMIIYKTDIHEEDKIVSRITSGLEYESQNTYSKIITSVENFLKFLGWNMIPIFILFLPLGSILFLKQLKKLKQFKFQDQVLIVTIISMSLPAFYAYSIPALDTRFLYFLYPIFCVISLYSIKSIFNRIRKQNIITIIIIGGIIITSVSFLEIKTINHDYEKDAFLFSLIISEKISGVNSYYPEDAYLTSASVIKNWPNILVSDKYGNPKMDFKIIETNEHDDLIEFIRDSKEKGLSHLVIDNNENRPDFLKIDPNKYPFLKNEEITIDPHGKYNGELYQIDYEEFFKIYD